MKHPEHQGLMAHFPFDHYPEPTKNQVEGIGYIEKRHGLVTIEAPTGTGKTAMGYTFLKEGQARGEGPLVYTTTNKALVQQVQKQHPDVQVAYGRNEHDCLYYGPEHSFKADEIPCLLLDDCPHRVDQETGETYEEGAECCPYYQQKYEAKKAKGIVAETVSFYLFTHLFAKEFARPARLVIDEAHKIAEIVRNALSYEISDYHLLRSVELLREIGADEEAVQIENFAKRMIRMIKRRSPRSKTLLEDEEIVELIEILEEIDDRKFKKRVTDAVKAGKVDRLEKREVLKKIETLIYDLRRYLRSLEYSRFTEKKSALNYTYAYYEQEKPEGKKVQYKLVIKAYYVAPIIQKLFAPKTLAMSATIGNPEYFGYETGIKFPFYALTSDFPAKNTLVCLPTDARNLAFNERSRQDLNRTLRKILRATKLFARRGLRSMLVVISNAEKDKAMEFAVEEGVKALTYGNGIPAREAVAAFKEGHGDLLIGTAAQVGEGVDLPGGICPITHFLRPGYQSPYDPEAQFEDRRFPRGHVWGLRQHRVMIQAVQVWGRNRRSAKDKGVCFFHSLQFAKFLYHALPEEFRQAYVKDKTFDECVEATFELLSAA